MMNNFFPPKPGNTVGLFCIKCHERFVGKLPGYNIFRNKFYKTKCPKCGSKKVTLDPLIIY